MAAERPHQTLTLFSRFSSWDDFFEAVRQYCMKTYQPFIKRSCKKKDGKYLYQTYQCSHRGVYNPAGKGIRHTKSSKEGCEAKIHACLSKENNDIIVVTVLHDEHNHEIGPHLHHKYIKQLRNFTKEACTVEQRLMQINDPQTDVSNYAPFQGGTGGGPPEHEPSYADMVMRIIDDKTGLLGDESEAGSGQGESTAIPGDTAREASQQAMIFLAGGTELDPDSTPPQSITAKSGRGPKRKQVAEGVGASDFWQEAVKTLKLKQQLLKLQIKKFKKDNPDL